MSRMKCGCEIICVEDDPDLAQIEYCDMHDAAEAMYLAIAYPRNPEPDWGILLKLAADIISDRGHERHQGLAKKLRQKAELEIKALEVATGIK